MQSLSYHPVVMELPGVGPADHQDRQEPSDQQQQQQAQDGDLITASNWAQHQSSHSTSRGGNLLHSSGVSIAAAGGLSAAARRTGSSTLGSGSTDGGSSGSSMHMGFFQITKQRDAARSNTAGAAAGHSATTAMPARPQTAGTPAGASPAAQRQQQDQQLLQDASFGPRTAAAGGADDQKREWLEFQQHAHDDAGTAGAVAVVAAQLFRSNSSPEPSLQMSMEVSQQLLEAAAAASHTWPSGRLQAATAAANSSSSRGRAPAAAQDTLSQLLSAARQAAAAAAGAGGVSGAAAAGTRPTAARLSLDGGARQMLRGDGSNNSSSSKDWVVARQARLPPVWQDLAPAGPELPTGAVTVTAPVIAGASEPLPTITREELLLLQQQQQQRQRQQSMGRSEWQQQQIMQLQRSSSTPAFVAAEQLQGAGPAGVAQLLPSAAAGRASGLSQQGRLQSGDLGYGHAPRPRSPYTAGGASGGAVRPASPALLSPEAAAAAAEAASSIQQAMAAVNDEMEQLRLLQHLHKERRRLQAQARVAVARAAATAAASVTASATGGGGRQDAAMLATHREGFVGSLAAQGRLGSWDSSAGSHVGNSSSSSGTTATHTSGVFSSNSLAVDQAPALTGYWAQQQQQQQEQAWQNGYGMPDSHQQLRRSEPGSGASAWSVSMGAAAAASMQRTGSLSPRALWTDATAAATAALDRQTAQGYADRGFAADGGFAESHGARPGHARSATWSDLPVDDFGCDLQGQGQQQQGAQALPGQGFSVQGLMDPIWQQQQQQQHGRGPYSPRGSSGNMANDPSVGQQRWAHMATVDGADVSIGRLRGVEVGVDGHAGVGKVTARDDMSEELRMLALDEAQLAQLRHVMGLMQQRQG